MPTPLYHATLHGGPTGLSFTIGDTLLFTPVHEDRLYVVQPDHLQVMAQVESDMAAFLLNAIVEPRLMRLTGGHG